MKKISDLLAGLLSKRSAELILFALILVLCAIGNLPWHLDNYDQAKQAYVSYEIQQGGSWWYQHTPRGDTATKPPLAGWISLPFYYATGIWDVAWRVPGYLCTIVLLLLLMREGRRILPDGGALLAACAFGLNLLTPRIATLVRTDIMLTLWITLCGWLIYRKIVAGGTWTSKEKWVFFAVMLAALFTKGPILYAFILPGMAVYWFLAPRDRRGLIWSGWWTWFVPLAIFGAWAGIGILSRQEFYNDVVVRELGSRFDQSLRGNERQQPIWFYFPHIIHKFAPWSVLLIALPIFSQNVRKACRERPEVLWLICWAVGGLLCMTFIPSKRVDRIFPVVPPFCLLLVSFVAACKCGTRVRAWCGGAVLASVFIAAGYFITIVVSGYLDRTDMLVRFGEEARRKALAAGVERLGVVDGRDEGLLMYAGGGKDYLKPSTARKMFLNGQVGAVLTSERQIKDRTGYPAPAMEFQPMGKNEAKYLLFIREK